MRKNKNNWKTMHHMQLMKNCYFTQKKDENKMREEKKTRKGKGQAAELLIFPLHTKIIF